MPQTRFSLALDKGLIELPATRPFGAWNAPIGFEPPTDETYVSQSFAPIFNSFKKAGLPVSPLPAEKVGASIVFCHRAKEATLDLLARAIDLTDNGGLILLEGDKTDGIDSAIKALKRITPELETYAKSHGKLAWFHNPGTVPADWRSTWTDNEDGFVTWPGNFSADAADAGSKFLLANLPPLKGRVADLGAGWGYLSHGALVRSPKITSATLIEADYMAAEAAKRNVMDSRSEVIWGDIHGHTGRYEAVLCNPPFHTSRKPDPAIGRAFLIRAASLLQEKGALWCVANRTLPYETTLTEHFRSVETVAETAGFKVLHARAPQRSKLTRSAPRSRVS